MLNYFIANDTTRCIYIIDEIIKNYNNSENSGIFNFVPKAASKPMIQYCIMNHKIEESQ